MTREAFEKWAVWQGHPIEKNGFGQYLAIETRDTWNGWLARGIFESHITTPEPLKATGEDVELYDYERTAPNRNPHRIFKVTAGRGMDIATARDEGEAKLIVGALNARRSPDVENVRLREALEKIHAHADMRRHHSMGGNHAEIFAICEKALSHPSNAMKGSGE